MITTEAKVKILEGIKTRRGNFPSASKMAVSLGISPSQFSRIMSGDIDRVISDPQWITIARKLEIQWGNSPAWVTARTPMFVYIEKQLEACQTFALSGLLCDIADIGKTYAAKCYVKENPNSVYIDCSQAKSKQKLIRLIAREYGLSNTGRYQDVYEDLIYYLKSITNPLIILDEAGDLDYPAFLELKAMWNATERACGWYMMGADGLKAKIESNLSRKKVGYAEIFSRFGNRYQKVSPEGKGERDHFLQMQASMVAAANGAPQSQLQHIYVKTAGSLRRIFTEVQKLKN